jgi:colanic acid/amylovoran biosynthesis glycosyltransferase
LHGQDVTRFDTTVQKRWDGRIYLKHRHELWEQTALFLCVSNFIRERALDQGFPEHKLRVHYIGIDRDRFPPSYKSRDRELVLFVGRLVPKKGCQHLLDAMHIVQRTHPDARTVVIGDGPERGRLTAQAERLNIHCQFLGPQNSQQINEWLERAGVFCAPSVTAPDGDSEGLGIVFAEAQATGLPVVSFAHGGIPEVVKAGVTGLLAPERDHVLLASHITRLIEDDRLWSSFSSEGIQWVADQFDIRQQTKTLEDIYREVISIRSSRRSSSSTRKYA